jgi:hypothetical protein
LENEGGLIMATNDRVAIVSGDISVGQLAPSQASRVNFTPGKATGLAGDMNWPKDHRIPTGTPAFDGEAAGPVKMDRTRVVKLGRNIISDQTVIAPVVTGTRVETRTEEGVSGANSTQDTVNPVNLANRERQAGNDNIEGA